MENNVDITNKEISTTFNSFLDSSRVWIYQSNRNLTDEEVNTIKDKTTIFLNDWKAHGTALKAAADILYNRFLIIMVDEHTANATGCSIDSSVHFVQSLQEKYQLDFFDRLQIAYKTAEGNIASFRLAEKDELLKADALTQETIIFNNTVTTKKDWDNSWEIPIKDSWM